MRVNTVYIVDDDKLNVDQFLRRSGIFLECGFEIAGYETDPLKALEAINAIRPDAVFSDLKMPGMNGIELWNELRRNDDPPLFIIISAYNEMNDIRQVFKSDGFDYLLKSVDDNELALLLIGVSKRINKNTPVLETETASAELNQILMLLKEYPAMNHTLESAGARCGIAPKTVCRLFSKHLNTTFLAHLTRLRMEKAEELLRSTDLMVKKIAALCGFPDQLYFTRVFKREHGGMAPSAYREGVK